ncbi:integumentary mucin A.1-like [Macrobrachium rosenbergii]|uniref:integumentary mucin A.1-like n=1 Tax=Macrobrachium rosenbergii TaxID=79674 RepID=UPI0034D39E40
MGFVCSVKVAMACNGKGGAVSPKRRVGWSLLPFMLGRQITKVSVMFLLLLIIVPKSARAKRPVAFEVGRTLPQHLIALEEREVSCSCYCRIKCMINVSCTAVSVLINKDPGVTNCLFSNMIIPLEELSEADSTYTWVHNATITTDTEASSSNTSEGTTTTATPEATSTSTSMDTTTPVTTTPTTTTTPSTNETTTPSSTAEEATTASTKISEATTASASLETTTQTTATTLSTTGANTTLVCTSSAEGNTVLLST